MHFNWRPLLSNALLLVAVYAGVQGVPLCLPLGLGLVWLVTGMFVSLSVIALLVGGLLWREAKATLPIALMIASPLALRSPPDAVKRTANRVNLGMNSAFIMVTGYLLSTTEWQLTAALLVGSYLTSVVLLFGYTAVWTRASAAYTVH